MPAAKNAEAEEVVETNGNGSTRISFTVDHSQRRAIRIAAAYADLDVGEWCAKVLARAADQAAQDQS